MGDGVTEMESAGLLIVIYIGRLFIEPGKQPSGNVPEEFVARMKRVVYFVGSISDGQ